MSRSGSSRWTATRWHRLATWRTRQCSRWSCPSLPSGFSRSVHPRGRHVTYIFRHHHCGEQQIRAVARGRRLARNVPEYLQVLRGLYYKFCRDETTQSRWKQQAEHALENERGQKKWRHVLRPDQRAENCEPKRQVLWKKPQNAALLTEALWRDEMR